MKSSKELWLALIVWCVIGLLGSWWGLYALGIWLEDAYDTGDGTEIFLLLQGMLMAAIFAFLAWTCLGLATKTPWKSQLEPEPQDPTVSLAAYRELEEELGLAEELRATAAASFKRLNEELEKESEDRKRLRKENEMLKDVIDLKMFKR